MIICVSGGIASGKTSLAIALAHRLNAATASFGRFVRAMAVVRGIPHERQALQDLGDLLIAELGWEGFCQDVLRESGWNHGASLVVDGVRHVAAVEAIRKTVLPDVTKLVFVEVSPELRASRAELRSFEGAALALADGHPTELDVHGKLRAAADLRLDGTRDVSSLVQEVCEAL